MTERLLQFIWQFRYFSKTGLATTTGEPIEIITPGRYNTNQGPDFSDAKIRIGNALWAGTVELHIKTSDWEKHDHQHDNNYKNVILHVVWQDDGSIGTIPVLELQTRVSKLLLQRYEELMLSTAFIPCEKSIHLVTGITWKSWKERLLAERLLRKAATVDMYLRQNNYHWEETFWRLLARNFGMKVNADAFEAMARSLPLTLLAKERHQLPTLEALLLGQAGLLEQNFSDEYPRHLQGLYRFQQAKHGIRPVTVPFHFLRMRPGNFPTVRLAQLAMLVFVSAHLFSRIREAEAVKEVRQWLEVTASAYWNEHYRFDEPSVFAPKKTGTTMTDTIIINTVAPVLFAYGSYHRENRYKDKALLWLEQTAAEKNAVTSQFRELSVDNQTAYDSQGLIELKNEYCDKRKCLECAVGNAILKT